MQAASTKSSVKRSHSMVRGLSVMSMTEDHINMMLMRSATKKLKYNSAESLVDSSSDETKTNDEEPISKGHVSSPASSSISNASPILFQRNVNDTSPRSIDSHSRSIIEKQRPPRKQDKSQRRKISTTKVIFKRKICKEPSPALTELRKVLVMEALESDSESSNSENEENCSQGRIIHDPAFLEFIKNSENKENIDLDDFKEKLKL